MPKREVSLQQAAAALNLHPTRLRVLCAQGRVKGARLVGPGGGRALWFVPVGADGRPQIDEASSGPKATWAPKKKRGTR